MSVYELNAQSFQFADTLAPFVQGEGLPFAHVLSADAVQQAFDAEHVSFGQTKRSFWTPALTLWTFLGQVLNADKSCRAAVARVIMALSLSRDPDQVDTGAYCRARAKLPASVLERLTLQVGRELEEAAPSSWLWQNRHVYLVDGFTATLPDTPDNQKAYPQARTQKKGVGLPIMRLVVLLSLATAVVQGLAYGPYLGKETSELSLFRKLLDLVSAGHIVLTDRFYCSYFMLAQLQQRDIDAVLRLHHRRLSDFRRGRRLGPGDHLVEWQKPKRPKWMDEATYASMPDTLQIREVYKKVDQPGFRVKELVIVTTLLDAEAYPAEEIAALYHQRWHVELDIRTIKSYLKMEHLSCQTPFMVEKELWAHMLAYNLVRKVAAQAALENDVLPRSISFTAARQLVVGVWQKLTEGTAAERQRRGQKLLRALKGERVGNRPNRCEPRAIKRRPKPHKLLTKPRSEARAELLGKRPDKS
jgi:hypothetical protein